LLSANKAPVLAPAKLVFKSALPELQYERSKTSLSLLPRAKLDYVDEQARRAIHRVIAPGGNAMQKLVWARVGSITRCVSALERVLSLKSFLTLHFVATAAVGLGCRSQKNPP
jgi:hypothetical protein